MTSASTHLTSFSNISDALKFVRPYLKGTFHKKSQTIHRKKAKFLVCAQINYLFTSQNPESNAVYLKPTTFYKVSESFICK
jgi:hypothetical protein